MTLAQHLEQAEQAPLTWDPEAKGKRGLLVFEDAVTHGLGEDPAKVKFNQIADRMFSGRYYPDDVIQVFGRFIEEGRQIKKGDRVVQIAKVGKLQMFTAVEIIEAVRTDTKAVLSYVTTKKHFAKGIWRAELDHTPEELMLTVQATVVPNSWQFWVGLPFARYLQKRAWGRAAQVFDKL